MESGEQEWWSVVGCGTFPSHARPTCTCNPSAPASQHKRRLSNTKYQCQIPTQTLDQQYDDWRVLNLFVQQRYSRHNPLRPRLCLRGVRYQPPALSHMPGQGDQFDEDLLSRRPR